MGISSLDVEVVHDSDESVDIEVARLERCMISIVALDKRLYISSLCMEVYISDISYARSILLVLSSHYMRISISFYDMDVDVLRFFR